MTSSKDEVVVYSEYVQTQKQQTLHDDHVTMPPLGPIIGAIFFELGEVGSLR